MASNRSKCLLLAPLLFVSCSNLSIEQQALLERVESLSTYPIDRNQLVTSLDLEQTTGIRSSGGIRGGNGLQLETWNHRSGLTVTGCNATKVPLENGRHTDQAIDRLIMGGHGPATSQELGNPVVAKPFAKSFQFLILSKTDETLFDSRLTNQTHLESDFHGPGSK